MHVLGSNPKCYKSSKATNQLVTPYDGIKRKVRRVNLLTLLLKDGVMPTSRPKPSPALDLLLLISQNLQRLETKEYLPKPDTSTLETPQKHEP